jgi:hypothetical protein
MDPYEDIFIPLIITAGYFATVYFFTTALFDFYMASIAAPVVMILAGLWLVWLRRIGMGKESLPLLILAYLPLVIFFCGIMAWLVRFLVG